MSRGRQSYRAHCNVTGCAEAAYYTDLTVTDRQRLARQYAERPWLCTRHDHPERIVAPDNTRVTATMTAAKSRRYPNLTKLFWLEEGRDDVGSGFMFGAGFKAFADDFPEGAVIRVTAEVVPPQPAQLDTGGEWLTCPGCSRDVLADELCTCDAEDGPKCLARCCELDHPVGRPFWKGDAA